MSTLAITSYLIYLSTEFMRRWVSPACCQNSCACCGPPVVGQPVMVAQPVAVGVQPGVALQPGGTLQPVPVQNGV